MSQRKGGIKSVKNSICIKNNHQYYKKQYLIFFLKEH